MIAELKKASSLSRAIFKVTVLVSTSSPSQHSGGEKWHRHLLLSFTLLPLLCSLSVSLSLEPSQRRVCRETELRFTFAVVAVARQHRYGGGTHFQLCLFEISLRVECFQSYAP
jgi:hypothetical protein